MKSKIIIAVITLIILQLPEKASGQTNVGGTLTSNTVWDVEGSPYLLTSTLGVASGVTLTINAGVEVQGNFDLLAKGDIAINGISGDSVTFSQTRLIFKSTNLSNSTIDYVKFSNSSGIQLADESEHRQDNPKNSGTLTVSNSKFNDNGYARTKGYDSGAKLTLVGCHFIDANIIKGYYPRSEIIEIQSSKIIRTTINSDSYNHGIFLRDSEIEQSDFTIGCCGSNFNLDNCTVNNCTFSDYNDWYNVNIDSSLVTNTTFDLSSGHLSISNSRIVSPSSAPFHIRAETVNFDNTIFDGKDCDLGIEIYGYRGINNGNSSIANCTFENYVNGIELDRFNDFKFQQNNFIKISGLILTNNWSSNISATENYWGTVDESIIAAKIFDGLDDINSGIVDFSNYLSSPTSDAPMSAPQNVFRGLQNSGIIISWDSNEQPNLAGYKVYHKTSLSDDFSLLADVGNVSSFYTDQITISDTIVVTSYSDQADGASDFLEGNESDYSEGADNYISNVSISSNAFCEGEHLEVELNSNYNFSDNFFILQLSDINGSFENAINLDSIASSTDTLSSVLPDTLQFGATYLTRILSSELNVHSNSSEITLYEIPNSAFSAVQESCQSDTVILQYSNELTDGLSLNWNLDGGEIVENIQDSLLEVKWSSLGVKEISLEATRNGCTSTNLTTINIIKTPTSDFSTQEFICEGESALITYNGNGADTASYMWDFDGGTIITGDGSGPYEISWTTYGEKNISLSVMENGCSSEISESTIIYYETPTSGFSSIQESCQFDTVSLEYEGELLDGLSLNWNLDGGEIVENIQDSLLKVKWSSFGVKEISLKATRNGCTSTNLTTINIIKTPTSDFSTQQFICEGESALITYNGNGADTASYIWDFDGGTIITGDGSGPYEISWGSQGMKNVSLSVFENGCASETTIKTIEYNEYASLLFEGKESVCYNENYQINFVGSNYTDVSWDFNGANVISGSGTGPYLVNWNTSGQKFINFSAVNNGCLADTTIIINVPSKAHTPEICMVTVDEESSKNMLIWSYDLETVNQFGIYRETNVSGDYSLVEYVEGGVSNTYVDNQSSPEQQSNRYKITTLDSCGTETELSNYHKTIHLTINKGLGTNWNLIWNGYEGFSFGTYRVFRSLDGGNFELLTEIASNLSSYTDSDVPSSDVAYQIEVLNPNECESNPGERILASSSSKSNIARNNAITGLSDLEKSIKLFPNPTSDFVRIQFERSLHGQYYLHNLMGQVIELGTLTEDNVIDMNDKPSGTYLITIKTSSGSTWKRFVKE